MTAFFELVLGDLRERRCLHIVTEIDPKTGACFARNAYNSEFRRPRRLPGLQRIEAHRDRRPHASSSAATAPRPIPPACRRRRLSGRVGAGLDPCAAMQVPIDLGGRPGTRDRLHLRHRPGSGRHAQPGESFPRHRPGAGGPGSASGISGTARWVSSMSKRPIASVNFLANGWLLYQVLACRVWGAQRVLPIGRSVWFPRPAPGCHGTGACPARRSSASNSLRCAARQFREGDVQHWWHPPLGRGVRTHISDDFLWLPYATCRYVTATGDTGMLDETVPLPRRTPAAAGRGQLLRPPAPIRTNPPRSTNIASGPSNMACGSASMVCR